MSWVCPSRWDQLCLYPDADPEYDPAGGKWRADPEWQGYRNRGQLYREPERTNPSLAEIIQDLWTQVQEEPERYRRKIYHRSPRPMIESIIDSHIVSFAKTGISEPTNCATISNTTAKAQKKQRRKSTDQESALQRLQGRSSRCPQPTQLQKQIKEAYTQLIEEVIEPLRVGR